MGGKIQNLITLYVCGGRKWIFLFGWGWRGIDKIAALKFILGRWSVVYDGNHSLVHLTDLQLASAGCPVLSGSGFPYSAMSHRESKERGKKERTKETQSKWRWGAE